MPTGSIPTKAGVAEITNSLLTGEDVKWTKIAVGDGNGSQYTPSETQTELVNQVWSGDIDEALLINDDQIQFHTVIPSNVGPFTIREVGILNDKDVLVAVACIPDQNKINITTTTGVSNDMDITFQLYVENANTIQVTVDPNVVIATRDYVDKKVEQIAVTPQEKQKLEALEYVIKKDEVGYYIEEVV